MDERLLGQALIAAPDCTHARIAEAVERIGWQRDPAIGPSLPPLVPGEPELAGWKWPGPLGGKPFLTYTFNPVVRLRVLDLSTAPPRLRAAVAAALPLVHPEAVEPLFRSAEPRQRLLALWIARETERVDLLASLRRLRGDGEPAVAQAAAETGEALERVLDARQGIMVQMQLLAEAARELFPRLADPAFTRGLLPSAEDCAALIDPPVARQIAAPLAAAYAEQVPTAHPGGRFQHLEVTAAPAALLRFHNELSEKFPGGYRDVAGFLDPGRVWMTWALRADGGGAVRYDGLAFLDDHWVWIPKAHRIVARIVATALGPAARPG